MSAENNSENKFIRREEFVGRVQPPGTIGRDIRAMVIGREFRGQILDHGLVQTYVKPMGNEQILEFIPGSHQHQGLSGDEYEIDSLEPLHIIRKLQLSPGSLTPGKEEILIQNSQNDSASSALSDISKEPVSITPKEKALSNDMEDFSDMQVPHTSLLAHR